MKIREDEVPFQPLSIQYIYANDLDSFKVYLLKAKLTDDLVRVLEKEQSTTGLGVLLFSVLYDRLDFVNYLFENYDFNLANTGIHAKMDIQGIEVVLRKLTYVFQIVEINDFEEFKKHLDNLAAQGTIKFSQILKWRHKSQTLYEYALLNDRIDIAIYLYLKCPQNALEVIHLYSQSEQEKLSANHLQVLSVYDVFKNNQSGFATKDLLICPQSIHQINARSKILGPYQFAYIQIMIDLLQTTFLIADSHDVGLGNILLNYDPKVCMPYSVNDEQKRRTTEMMLLYIDINLQDNRAASFKVLNSMLMARQIETLSALGKGMSGLILSHPNLVLTLFEAIQKQAEKIVYLEKQNQALQDGAFNNLPKTDFLPNFKALNLNEHESTEKEEKNVRKHHEKKKKRALTK